MSKATVLHVDRLDLRLDATVWTFATERRAEIDAHFAQLQAAKPALFNGRVLLLREFTIEDGVMRGSFLETDYASFVAWQDWGRPSVNILDCFGSAAIESSDGAFLLGVMGAHTFNAGHLYFPCGTPDPSDIGDGGSVDLDFNIRRELQEETGLDAAVLEAESGWTVILDGTVVAIIKVMRSGMAADPLRLQILHNMAREEQPELSDIRIMRSAADFDPMMRGYARTFLTQRFA
jgi:8-oxo-dGTP pyrophosphatase MutT (NUDIX family)